MTMESNRSASVMGEITPKKVVETPKKFPQPGDTAAQIKSKKATILATMMPASLIPVPSSTGFLIFGSRDTPCFYNIRTYMVVAGAISIGIPIMGVMFKNMLECMLSDSIIDEGEAKILLLMELVAKCVVLIEAGLLVLGSVIILPHLSKWQSDDINDTETYCDFGLVLFSTAVIVTSWLFIFLAAAIYVYTRWFDKDRVTKADEKPPGD